MRTGALATALVALLAVSACKGSDSAMSDDLARDVASIDNTSNSTSDLALAPSSGSRSVVSAVERAPEARPRMAKSSRSITSAKHRTQHHTPAARAVPSPTELATAAAVPEAAAAEPAAADPAPAPAVDPAPAEQPAQQPVDVGSTGPQSGRGDGPISSGRGHGGFGIGGIIGAIGGALGGAILRGGEVDGDHCDPRRGRRGLPGGRGYPQGIPGRSGPMGPVLRGSW